MRCAIIYCAVTHGERTFDHCARFVSTWNTYPPNHDCDLIVACQGGPLATETAMLFAGLNAKFWPRINDESRDIGAYLDAAKTIAKDYDMLLCLGESVSFVREGWLKRLVEAWQRYGPGMYGFFGSHVVRAHLQTTAFAIAPQLLREYPLSVTDRKSRYEFEHGERALWRRLYKRGVPVKLVLWNGEWSPGQWRLPQNCIWRGNQSNLLMHCNHVDKFREADEKTKRTWTAWADSPFH